MIPITAKGKKQLELKLEQLKKEFKTLPSIIGEARKKGDLKENADYHAAKERQGMLNAEIQKISGDLHNCQVIDITTLPKDIVTFGKKVSLIDLENNEEFCYQIVNPFEANAKESKISIKSLVAKALLGKKAQTKISIQVPSGEKNYQITKISL